MLARARTSAGAAPQPKPGHAIFENGTGQPRITIVVGTDLRVAVVGASHRRSEMVHSQETSKHLVIRAFGISSARRQ